MNTPPVQARCTGGGRRNLQPDVAEAIDQVLDTKGAMAVAVENLPEVDRYPVYAEEFMRHGQETDRRR